MRLIKKASLAGLGSVLFLMGSVTPALAESGPYNAVQTDAKAENALRVAAGEPGKETPVEAKISKDEAISLARKALQIPEDYKVNGVNYGDNQGPGFSSEPTWNINFAKTVQDRNIGGYYVTLGANTGRLLNWGKYDNDPEKRAVFPPKADFQKAKEIALQYLQSVNPEEIKQTRYNDTFERSFQTPLYGDITYIIRYDRTVNGIPFPVNGLTVNVNGNGDIVGYTYQWDDNIKFEDASAVINHEQAVDIISKESEPTLSYIFPYQPNQERKPIASYQMIVKPVDAKTGKTWTWGGSVEEKPDRTPLAESPLAEKPNPDHPLSKEQAIEAVTAFFGLPEDAQLEEANYSEYQAPYQTAPTGNWNIRWKIADKDNPKRYIWIYAGVDAYTGQVRNYNKQDDSLYAAGNNNESPKISFEEAKAKAEDAVKKAVPYYVNQIYLLNAAKPSASNEKYGIMPAYNFQYKRAVDGVDTEETVGVTIHRDTGEITQFYSGISDTAYPEHKPEVLDPVKAREILLSRYDVELQYVLQPKNQEGLAVPYGFPFEKYSALMSSRKIPPGPASEMEGKLVYLPVFKQQGYEYDTFLDAVTGQWRLRSTGEETQLGKPEATDISGNPAEQALRLVVEYRALDLKDGKVNPDQVITRGEMIKMLLIAMNGGHFPISFDAARAATFNDVAKGSAYFAYVETAADQNLIDRNQKAFRPEDPLTREALAELLVRALGYNQLAGQAELFRLDVSDADEITRKGQAAIVIGLGIVPAVDGKFAPGAEVSRADAAAAFFRYLEKRASLQERPGYYGYYK